MKPTNKNKTKGYTGLVFSKSPKDYKLFDLRSAKPTYYVMDEDNLEEDNPGMVVQETDKIKFKVMY